MFTALHALAKQATLMITIAAEGDDQLRVTVTPMPFDGKAKANLPQPLSLVATPDEFDADFGAAILTWQAPKRSLLQQAQEASAESLAPAAASKTAAKPEKSSRKPTRGKSDASEQEPAALQTAGEAAGDAAAAVDQVMTDSTVAASSQADGEAAGDVKPAAAAAADAADQPQADLDQVVAAAPVDADHAKVDTVTLDLF